MAWFIFSFEEECSIISIGPVYNYSMTQVTQFLLALVPITKGNLSKKFGYAGALCPFAETF